MDSMHNRRSPSYFLMITVMVLIVHISATVLLYIDQINDRGQLNTFLTVETNRIGAIEEQIQEIKKEK